MKLEQITGRNIKGQTFNERLTKMNFIFGENFTGKTARADAIRLLLLGYLPELGKTPGATFGLSSDKDMEVTGTFDGGLPARREWFLKGNSVVQDATVPGFLEEKKALTSVMLSADTYFALGPTDRVRYIFNEVGPITPDTAPGDCSERMMTRLARDLTGVEDLNGPAIDSFVSYLETNAKAEQSKLLTGWTVQSFTAWLVEATAAAHKTAKATADVMQKTAQGLMHLRTKDAPAVNTSELQQKIDLLRGELQKAMNELAVLGAQERTQRGNAVRSAELKRRAERKTLYEEQKRLAEVRITEKEAARDALPEADEGMVADLEIQRQAAEREYAKQHAEAQRWHKVAEEAIAEWQSLMALEKCPCCGADGVAWKLKRELELNSATSSADALAADANRQKTQASILAKELTTRLASVAAASAKRRAITNEIDSLRRGQYTIETDINNAKAAEEMLASLPADDPAIAGKYAAANEAVQGLAMSIRDNEETIRTANTRQNDLKRLAQAELERDAAVLKVEVAKAAVEITKKIQREAVDEALTAILKLANRFFGDILPSPLGYRDGEIGTWRQGQWISTETFSGTEQMLAYAAIQAALTVNSPLRIMILDEMGRMDPTNLAKVGNRIAEAIKEGLIDQFIGIGASREILYAATKMPIEDMTVIELSKPAAK